MMSPRAASIVNISFFGCVLVLNYLANQLPLGGVTQRELAAEYQLLLTPAGYAFSIWGVIYLGLVVYIVSQALPQTRSEQQIRSLDKPFRISCFCNMGWLFAWHHRAVTISVFLMLGLLLSVAWAYRSLDKERGRYRRSSEWIIERTFSLYLGWVSIAMTLNLSIFFSQLGWSGLPLTPQTWATLLLVLLSILFLALAIPRRDFALLFVLAWAALGIFVKNRELALISATSLSAIALSLFTGLYLLKSVPPAREGASL